MMTKYQQTRKIAEYYIKLLEIVRELYNDQSLDLDPEMHLKLQSFNIDVLDFYKMKLNIVKDLDNKKFYRLSFLNIPIPIVHLIKQK